MIAAGFKEVAISPRIYNNEWNLSGDEDRGSTHCWGAGVKGDKSRAVDLGASRWVQLSLNTQIISLFLVPLYLMQVLLRQPYSLFFSAALLRYN